MTGGPFGFGAGAADPAAGSLGGSSPRRQVTISVTVSRQRHPRDPTTKVAAIVAAIARRAQGRELVVCPAFVRHAIGCIALTLKGSRQVARVYYHLIKTQYSAARAGRTRLWMRAPGERRFVV